MRTRSVLLTAATAAALSLVPVAAQAAKPTRTELSLRAFDPAAVVLSGSLQFAGTAYDQPFTGPSQTTIRALDGTLPAANTCEPGAITVQVDPATTERLSITAEGELCATFYGDAWTIFASYDRKDVTYTGTEHARVRSEGFLSAAVGSLWPGSGQVTVDGTLTW